MTDKYLKPNGSIKDENKSGFNSKIKLNELREVDIDKIINELSEVSKSIINIDDEYELIYKLSTIPSKSSDNCLIFYFHNFLQWDSKLSKNIGRKSKSGEEKDIYAVERHLKFKGLCFYKVIDSIKKFNDIKNENPITEKFDSIVNNLKNRKERTELLYVYFFLKNYWKTIQMIVTNQLSKNSYDRSSIKSSWKIPEQSEKWISFSDNSFDDVDPRDDWDTSNIIVGVLDEDKVMSEKLEEKDIIFKSYITENDFKTKPDYQEYLRNATVYKTKTHGDKISSLIAYGPRKNNDNFKIKFEVKYFGIFKHGNKTEDWDDITARIEKVIEKYHEKIKYWNLSINLTYLEADPVEGSSPPAMWLDELQRKYNILIFNSGGNRDKEDQTFIFSPSETLFGVTVNSINDKNDMAKYSLKGYSNFKGIKPDLAAFGGEKDTSLIEIYSIYKNEHFGLQDEGTSYATPMALRRFLIYEHEKQINSPKDYDRGDESTLKIINEAIANIMEDDKQNIKIKKPYVGNGYLKSNLRDDFTNWIFDMEDDIRYQNEAYTNLHLPYNKKIKYKIIISFISEVNIDKMFGVELIRSNVTTDIKLSIPNDSNSNKSMKNKYISFNKNKGYKPYLNMLEGKEALFESELNNRTGKYRRLYSFTLDLFSESNEKIINESGKVIDDELTNVSIYFTKNHKVLVNDKYEESKNIKIKSKTLITFVPDEKSNKEILEKLLIKTQDAENWSFVEVEVEV